MSMMPGSDSPRGTGKLSVIQDVVDWCSLCKYIGREMIFCFWYQHHSVPDIPEFNVIPIL
jgi:hypothetical protein